MIEQTIPSSNGLVGSQNDTVSDFVVSRFTEDDFPEGAQQAQRIHAESYFDSGYVDRSSIGEDGCLLPELDTSRGTNVEYYLGRVASRHGGHDWVSLRRKSIPFGGDVGDLSAFQNSRPHLYVGEELLLRNHVEQHGLSSLVEIGALAKTKNAPSSASMRLVRRAVLDAAYGNPHEKWLILFAKPAYESMRRFFGPRIARQVGEEISSVREGSRYVNPRLNFIPSVIEPALVIDTLAAESLQQSLAIKERNMRKKALEFMCDDIPRGVQLAEVIS